MDAAADLERGRRAHGERDWRAAYERLSAADGAIALGGEDLELLASAAYMCGRDEEYLGALERAHQVYLDAGAGVPAVRCAFWVGINLARRGEVGRASGWLGRAERIVEREGGERVERGYLLLPDMFRHEASGELEAAAATAAEAATIAQRFADADLFALAVSSQGQLLIEVGRIGEGLRLLDESMVAVTAGEVSPIVSGLVYCGVILGCQDAHEVRRAHEWTAALTRWCEQQQGIVAFTGRCLVHRAELLELRGEWSDALAEARQAAERFALQGYELAAAEAIYRQAEVHRLRGEADRAEELYREASRGGFEPQPGLALLRLAQGDVDTAAAAIRRVLEETSGPAKRGRLLAPCVEILLAAGEQAGADTACSELEQLAREHEDGMLGALAAQSRGAVELGAGSPRAALPALRHACRVWQELEAPYEAARTRELVAAACRAVGDGEASALELDAARTAFQELGAAPDAARLAGSGQRGPHDLTPRELEVLRLVAAGGTNKAIATELVLSERTVDRHVSNIFAKLRVPSRAAATAYAYEHRLL